jgi:hypothetical protein
VTHRFHQRMPRSERAKPMLVFDRTHSLMRPPVKEPTALPSDVRTDDDAEVIERSWHQPERFGAIFDVHYAEIHRYVARRLDVDVADAIALNIPYDTVASQSAVTSTSTPRTRIQGLRHGPRTRRHRELHGFHRTLNPRTGRRRRASSPPAGFLAAGLADFDEARRLRLMLPRCRHTDRHRKASTRVSRCNGCAYRPSRRGRRSSRLRLRC